MQTTVQVQKDKGIQNQSGIVMIVSQDKQDSRNFPAGCRTEQT